MTVATFTGTSASKLGVTPFFDQQAKSIKCSLVCFFERFLDEELELFAYTCFNRIANL